MPKKRSTPCAARARPIGLAAPVERVVATSAPGSRGWRLAGGRAAPHPVGTAPDVPPTDPPSRVVQTWCTLQAHYWEHLAQYWHERARTAEETSADIALVMAAAREALQTLVRRVLDALDASGAPNPSVPEVCRELLKELEAVPWGALVAEEERARAARREGVHKTTGKETIHDAAKDFSPIRPSVWGSPPRGPCCNASARRTRKHVVCWTWL